MQDDPSGGGAAPGVEPATAVFTPYGSQTQGQSIVEIAQSAVAELELPEQPVEVGPPASLNEWNMNAVGQPLWLWAGDPAPVSETVQISGVSLEMVARYSHSDFDMGDGSTVSCRESTKWVRGAQPPGTPSPTCGYSYAEPDDYTVNATHHWTVHWSALGQSGTIPLTSSSSFSMKVGELSSVIVDRGPLD